MRICLHQSCADTRTTARTSGAVYDFCFYGAPLPSMLIVVVSDMSVSEMPLKTCCANILGGARHEEVRLLVTLDVCLRDSARSRSGC